MQFYLVCALVFALAVAIFAVQNTAAVTISFLLWQFKTSLVIVILGSASLGALFVFAVGTFKNVTNWRKIKELKGKNKILQEELENYKKKDLEEDTDDSLNNTNLQ